MVATIVGPSSMLSTPITVTDSSVLGTKCVKTGACLEDHPILPLIRLGKQRVATTSFANGNLFISIFSMEYG